VTGRAEIRLIRSTRLGRVVRLPADELDYVFHPGPGSEHLGYSEFLQPRESSSELYLREMITSFRPSCFASSTTRGKSVYARGQYRQTDCSTSFLNGGGTTVRAFAVAGVDDLHPCVA